MAKRVKKLSKLNDNNVSASMYTVLDHDSGTYAATIRQVVGSVLGKSEAPDDPARGLGSLRLDILTDELVMSPTVNIPPLEILDENYPNEGGSISLWWPQPVDANSRVEIDIYKDSDGIYQDSEGASRGARDYFRIMLNNNGTWYSGLQIDRESGEIFKSSSTSDTYRLIPIGTTSGVISEDADIINLQGQITALQSEIDTLKSQQFSTNAMAHVGSSPPGTLTKGVLWWDTNNTTMYIYDGNTWVVANTGGATSGTS